MKSESTTVTVSESVIRANVPRLYIQGRTPAYIAEKCGVTVDVVFTILKENDFAVPDDPHALPVVSLEDSVAELKRLSFDNLQLAKTNNPEKSGPIITATLAVLKYEAHISGRDVSKDEEAKEKDRVKKIKDSIKHLSKEERDALEELTERLERQVAKGEASDDELRRLEKIKKASSS